MMSATTFTLIGIGNKFFTLLLNVLIWDKHTSTLGIVVVCVCLIASVFYQQTPKRISDETAAAATDTSSSSAVQKSTAAVSHSHSHTKDVESLHELTTATEKDPLLPSAAAAGDEQSKHRNK